MNSLGVMLSDALFVLLPSVGFAQCVASIFLLIVFLKVKRKVNVCMAGLAIAGMLLIFFFSLKVLFRSSEDFFGLLQAQYTLLL